MHNISWIGMSVWLIDKGRDIYSALASTPSYPGLN